MEVFMLLRSKHCHPYRRRKVNRLLKPVLAGAVTLTFIVCVVVPLTFHYSPGLQRFFLFLNTDAVSVAIETVFTITEGFEDL